MSENKPASLTDAVRELVQAARVGAQNIALYKPKNDLLSAALTVELMLSEEGIS